MNTIIYLILLSNTGFVLCHTAFTLGQTNHLYLSHGEQLTYNKVITNLSANFDSAGSFVCTEPGVYAFHFFSLAHLESRVWIELYKNTNYVCSIFGHTVNGYSDAGNSVLLHLDEHDTVSIKSHASYNSTLYGSKDQIYTTFTGVLLISDKSDPPTKAQSFSVGLDHHFHSTNGDIVKYNNVVLNSNGYNPLTGKFTAAVDGTYIFHYHALTQENTRIWLELYHNDEYVNSAFGHTESAFADAGNTAILHLASGDQVYINAKNDCPVDLYGDSNDVYTTFSGTLLKKISHDSDDSQTETSFSVGLSQNFTGIDLIFNRVFSNRGDGYNPTTGHFTAKESGVYVFHFHALSRSNAEIWMELYHNYQYIDSLYGAGGTNGGTGGQEFATGSNAAVLNLVAGDTVFLKSRNSNDSYYGALDQVYCTFSGYKLESEDDLSFGIPGELIG